MELMNEFQLFSFLPALALGGLVWYERMHRHAGQKRTRYLAFSLVSLFLAAVIQTLAWVYRSAVPYAWPQVFVLSGLLYFSTLIFLEYAIHVKRIEESFLAKDFRNELRTMAFWLAPACLVAVIALAASASWQGVHKNFPLNLFLDADARANPLLGYAVQMRGLVVIFSGFLIVAGLLAALRLFNLRGGVIRKRGYPFFVQTAVTLVVLAAILLSRPTVSADTAFFLPLGWFSLLNLVYVIRLLEEFYFWSLYQVCSDRNRIEQRQHLQKLLIRRIIGSADEDRTIVHDIMETALEKVRSRLVVEEYQITGMVAYRAAGNLLRVWEPCDLIGSCTPLTNQSPVSQDSQELCDQILSTVYDLPELDGSNDDSRGFGPKLLRKAILTRRIVVESELPDALKGLQRLVIVVPVFDSERLMGVLTVFKDSFDRLYPAEKDVLEELAENLATAWALIAGKEIQREKYRFQGDRKPAHAIPPSPGALR